MDVHIWKVRVLVPSEAPQGENKGFDLASCASTGCFDYRFILEEEFMWVGVSVVLWEDGRVEAWRPLELLEFHQKGGCRGLLVAADAAATSFYIRLLLRRSSFLPR